MSSITRDFIKGEGTLCRKIFSREEESGENIYFKVAFQNFLNISDTMLFPVKFLGSK